MVPRPPHGPAGPARRCAALPARLRPTGLPPALSPPLPPFPQAEPARSSLSPPPQPPPPPPPGVNALASAGRTPWSPARVPGARLPLRFSHRRPLPPAPPPPPSAGAAGNCSRLLGGGASEGGGVGGEPRISRLDSRSSVHVAFRVMPRKDLPSHCSPVEPTPATPQKMMFIP